MNNTACIKNFYLSIILKIILLTVCGYGLCLHISLISIGYNIRMFSYFTVLSNLFCFVITLYYILIETKNKISSFVHKCEYVPFQVYTRTFSFLKGMSLMAIILTFLIFHFVVARNKYPLLYHNILVLPEKDLFAHYLVPLLYVLDWLLFQPKNTNTVKCPIYWLSYPSIYLITILIRIFVLPKSSPLHLYKFPYFFMDIEKYGIRTFCILMILILIVILAIGYSIIGIERLCCFINSLIYQRKNISTSPNN